MIPFKCLGSDDGLHNIYTFWQSVIQKAKNIRPNATGVGLVFKWGLKIEAEIPFPRWFLGQSTEYSLR
jgi:hypothetical protein